MVSEKVTETQTGRAEKEKKSVHVFVIYARKSKIRADRKEEEDTEKVGKRE